MYQLPSLTKDLLFMDEIADLFPWVRDAAYKQRLVNRFNALGANRTQVLSINSKSAFAEELSAFCDSKSFKQHQPCNSPPQKEHFQVKEMSEWTGQDYEQLLVGLGIEQS